MFGYWPAKLILNPNLDQTRNEEKTSFCFELKIFHQLKLNLNQISYKIEIIQNHFCQSRTKAYTKNTWTYDHQLPMFVFCISKSYDSNSQANREDKGCQKAPLQLFWIEGRALFLFHNKSRSKQRNLNN